MKRTSRDEVSIHAVFAASSLGGSAAAARGAYSRGASRAQRSHVVLVMGLSSKRWHLCTSLVRMMYPEGRVAQELGEAEKALRIVDQDLPAGRFVGCPAAEQVPQLDRSHLVGEREVGIVAAPD